MSYEEKIDGLGLNYKLGVENDLHLLFVYQFDDFKTMLETAKEISEKYKSDMERCRFIIQAFIGSYDFKTSCLIQLTTPVCSINNAIEKIAKMIFEEYEEKEGTKK